MWKKHIKYLSLLLLLLGSCSSHTIFNGDTGTAVITILYTNDEHGWMEATETHAGAAGLMGLWENNEGYAENNHFLILSGGDMWTGPAISTWFQGKSMGEVMNAMHYDAAAIGNHEFDFQVAGLQERLTEAAFPFLSANIREKVGGNIPDFARPYLIKKVDGVNVGILGLSTISTPLTTFPDYVSDYYFIDYESTLNEYIPKMKEEGAELLIILGHICLYEMQALAPRAKALGISAIFGGHCHEVVDERSEGMVLLESGSNMQNYAKLEIRFDRGVDKVLDMNALVLPNTIATPDTHIAAIVSKWKTRMDSNLSRVIGYVQNEIPQDSDEMYNMVTDSWLVTFPQADISLTNKGGIRQSVPAGDISLETSVGLLPFENTILELDMTGQELADVINERLVFGGMTITDGYKLADGTPIHMDSVYQVLTTDYLYSRPDYSFQIADPEPYSTSVHYRQPVIDWIESLNTSSAQPLDGFLDYEPRR